MQFLNRGATVTVERHVPTLQQLIATNRGATVTVERHVPTLQQLIATNSKGSTKQEDESRPDPA
jgi:hypothetical protein